MSWFYRHAARPVLFSQDSESIHNQTLASLGWCCRYPWICRAISNFIHAPALPVQTFGLSFPNPVGLAAGMDKHAAAVPFWRAIGFGFAELGGVTQHPQPGNPKPRMFRVAEDDALINRMGFNNGGALAMAQKLQSWRAAGQWPAHPIGINLGKSKITPLQDAAQDYLASFHALRELADFFVVNVSSPNTPNLRKLQDRSALDEILAAIQESNLHPHRTGPTRAKPILVKVAPDLSFEALDEILELASPRNLAGIVATNTTLARPTAKSPDSASVYRETGGLSGRPLAKRATEVIRHLYRQSRGRLPIIGVGGILTPDDAWEKITAGATLIQLYSGLVYQGPSLIPEIIEHLAERLGSASWESAVGSATR